MKGAHTQDWRGICIKEWENGRGLNKKEQSSIKGLSLNSTGFCTFPSWDPKYFLLLLAMVSHHKRNIFTSTQKLKLWSYLEGISNSRLRISNLETSAWGLTSGTSFFIRTGFGFGGETLHPFLSLTDSTEDPEFEWWSDGILSAWGCVFFSVWKMECSFLNKLNV